MGSAYRSRLVAGFAGGLEVLLVAGASPVALAARAAIDGDTVLDTVRVEAPREIDRRRDPPFVSVIRPADVAPGDDAPRLLDRTLGLEVRRTGGIGAYGTASLRGSPAAHVQVFQDGIPLLTASEAAVDLSSVPLTSFQRIEVFRSGVPSHLPGAGAAGAIHFVSGDARIERPEGEASFRVGSEETRSARFVTRLPVLGFESTIGAGLFETEGDFRFLNRNGTLENADDDVWTDRRNNDAHESDVFVLLRRRATTIPLVPFPIDLVASRQTLSRGRGVPGTENIQTTAVRSDLDRSLDVLRATFSPAPPLYVTGGISNQRIVDRFFNEAGEVSLGRAAWENETRQRFLHATIRAESFGDRLTAIVSGDDRAERLDPHDLLRDTDGYTRRRRQRSLTIESRVRILDDRASVSIAHAWLRSRDNYTGPPPPIFVQPKPFPSTTRDLRGPMFGARVSLGAGFIAKANHGWLGRLPTFLELFGQNGVQEGNPTLEPEKGEQTDAGVSWVAAAGEALVEAGVAVYRKDLDAMILLAQNSQRTTKAFNLDRARIEGIELEAEVRGARLPGRVRGWGRLAATFLDARNTGPSEPYRGKKLPYEPPVQVHAGVGFERGPVSAGYRAAFESATFRDRYNSPDRKTPDRTLHDVTAAWALPWRGIRVSIEIVNLLDARTLDLEGYPLPGRSWFLGTDVGW